MFPINIYHASAFHAVFPEVADALLADGSAWEAEQWFSAIYPDSLSYRGPSLPRQTDNYERWFLPAHVLELIARRKKIPTKQIERWPAMIPLTEARLHCGRSWQAMHCVLSDGTLAPKAGSYPLNHVVLGGRHLCCSETCSAIYVPPEPVRDVSASLQSIDEASFRKRYSAIDPNRVKFPVSRGECDYTWRRFQAVRAFYQWAAAQNLAVFFTAKTTPVNLEQFESWLGPNACSDVGFLGANDSLADTIAADARLLQSLGVSHEEIAGQLEAVLFKAHLRMGRLSMTELDLTSTLSAAGIQAAPDHIQAGGGVSGFGYQECPSGCANELDFIYPQFKGDWWLRNQRTGESMHLAGLLVHLIREHYFFEGMGTPYRANPDQLVRILELRP